MYLYIQYNIYIHMYVHCILCRASYFSSTPTDKMYRVVAAVKALYDQLGDMGERSIDGDSFLDLWIYVIIKANVKDLVSGAVCGFQFTVVYINHVHVHCIYIHVCTLYV